MQKILFVGGKVGVEAFNLQRLMCAWCNRSKRNGALFHVQAIGSKGIRHLIIAEIVCIIVLVEDVQRGSFCILPSCFDILIHFLYLVILRFRRLISKDNTIHNKLSVVGSIPEIAAIGSVTLAFFGIVVHALVYPIPDGSTHKVV